ncbi:PAQR family membrane homeostasis protein TrhA [Novacetimonas pomaceti]|uniref:Hemolysin III n=1 Tax=Novacetimonas pomaceti TaxID=2021998 RepID=A0ABX5P2K0_9PROT|nr:hemolysin III family protein [Novacetimonas pomaceti]PYD47993.1 hemolysin III [Novacetimonas pomaceti]
MRINARFPSYTLFERVADFAVHIVGVVVMVAGAGWLGASVPRDASWAARQSVFLYGSCLILVCFCSAAYNFCPACRLKGGLQRVDQAMIFIAIASTYTPFIIMGGSGALSLWFCMLLWVCALAGMAMKLFWFAKSQKYQVIPYLAVAWMFFLCPDPVFWHLPFQVVLLIILGLAFYSIGTVFYNHEDMPFSNVLWHVFVVLGASTHIYAVKRMIDLAT